MPIIEVARNILAKILSRVKRPKAPKFDPMRLSKACPYNIPNKSGEPKKCQAKIFENQKQAWQLIGECGKPCPFMAEFFAVVYGQTK
jgi:hypothetical protein